MLTIAEHWYEMEREGLLDTLTASQRTAARRFFYAGAIACYRTLEAAARSNTPNGAEEIVRELLEFETEQRAS